MKRWEYLIGFLDASYKKEGIYDFAEKFMELIGDNRKYSPAGLLTGLTFSGINGWELISLTPVPHTLEDGRIIFSSTAPSNTYLYVMKKRVPKKKYKQLLKKAKSDAKKMKHAPEPETVDPGWKIKE